MSECCVQPLVAFDRKLWKYMVWHGFPNDAAPHELRCYQCDKVVWPNTEVSDGVPPLARPDGSANPAQPVTTAPEKAEKLKN